MQSKKVTFLMCCIQYVVLAIGITATATILSGGGTVRSFILNMAAAIAVNAAVGQAIPVEKIGIRFAELCGAKKGTLLFKALRIFAINVIFVTIISFSMALIHNGFVSNIFSIWVKTYFILHLVGYMISFVIESPAQAIALKIAEET